MTFATVPVRAVAAVPTSPSAIVIVTETSLTPSENAEVLVRAMDADGICDDVDPVLRTRCL